MSAFCRLPKIRIKSSILRLIVSIPKYLQVTSDYIIADHPIVHIITDYFHICILDYP